VRSDDADPIENDLIFEDEFARLRVVFSADTLAVAAVEEELDGLVGRGLSLFEERHRRGLDMKQVPSRLLTFRNGEDNLDIALCIECFSSVVVLGFAVWILSNSLPVLWGISRSTSSRSSLPVSLFLRKLRALTRTFRGPVRSA